MRGVAEAGLIAVVGSVDTEAFGEQALASLLADLTRIELLGRAHHQVITCVAARGPVPPLRLATVCGEDRTVRRLLAQRSREFAVLLETSGHGGVGGQAVCGAGGPAARRQMRTRKLVPR